ncbi:MAG: class I SAM-dependent methyltransferase [Terriglobia bacterium]
MTHYSRWQVPREFDRLASTYARCRTAKSEREGREFADWFGLRSQESVLDAACGPGTLAGIMARRCARTFALDISPRMLELARRHDRLRQAPLTVGDVETLPYAGGTFDVVTCTYAFANFRQPLSVLREFARVTRADGRIAIIDVVAPADPKRRSRLNQAEALRSHLDTHILSRGQFLKLFKAAGLVVLRSACHSSCQSVREWLERSPARIKRPARIREVLPKLVDGARAEPRSGQRTSGPFVSYTTQWFVLCKRT